MRKTQRKEKPSVILKKNDEIYINFFQRFRCFAHFTCCQKKAKNIFLMQMKEFSSSRCFAFFHPFSLWKITIVESGRKSLNR